MLEVIGRTGKSRLLGMMGKEALLLTAGEKPVKTTSMPQTLFDLSVSDITILNHIYKTTRKNDPVIFYVNNNKQILEKVKQLGKMIDNERFVIIMHD